ncbi:MAG: CARDB domain-containing protein, partial [Archaeoglobaceae archaeon]
NLFNNTENVETYESANTWNTTLQQGTNILGGNWLGGNAWLNPDETGYSQTCIDTQEPIGICDQPYMIDENNIDYLSLSVAPTQPMPDLNITAISITPMQPIVNQQATINATIANIGNANAGAFNVSFYANNVLIEKVRISGLNAGGSIIASITWTPSSAGNYTIKVIADSDNNVIESNENNNENSKTFSVVEKLPDLVPEVKVPAFVKKFKNNTTILEAEFTVKNDGLENVSKFEVKADYASNSFRTEIEETLGAGEKITFRLTAVADPNAVEESISCEGRNCTIVAKKELQLQEYRVNITIDPDNQIGELNEENNMATAIFSVTRPDLVPILIAGSRINAGSSITVGVENAGKVFAEPTKLNVSIGNETRTFNVSRLEANQRWTQNITLDTIGIYTIQVTADANNDEAETNETNNAASAIIEVFRGSDLSVSIHASQVMFNGTQNEIIVYVRNELSTSSSEYVLKISVNNMEIYNATHEALSGFAGNVTRLIWTPNSVGDFIIKAEIDCRDDVNLFNNVSTISVRVEEYSINAYSLSYPYWVYKNDTFWVGCYFYVSHSSWVNATLVVPEGLEIVGDQHQSIYAGPWGYGNSAWWQVKGVKGGYYGNGTDKRIDCIVTANGKSDTITSNESPSWPLHVYVPTIWIHDVNSTQIKENGTYSMTFKTLNVTTFEQRITLKVQSVEGRTLSGLGYLVYYPYGCVEQTTSAMLGASHVDSYYRSRPDGRPVGYDYGKVESSVLAGIQRLSKCGERGQHENGSWSMWGTNPSGDTFYTAYGSYGLGIVKMDDWFGGNVSIGDACGQVNFSKTVSWFNSLMGEGYLSTYSYYPGTVRVTALAMISHYGMFNYLNNESKEIANETMKKATAWLISKQLSNGSWKEEYYYGSYNVMSTAMAVLALKLYGTESENVSRAQIENAIEKGIQWLISAQTSDGSWSSDSGYWWDWYGSKSETTALALLALNESRSISQLNFTVLGNDNETISKGIDYLSGIYRQHGSWGYTRATALALQALTKMQPVEAMNAVVKIYIDGLSKEFVVNSTNPVLSWELSDYEVRTVANNCSVSAGEKRCLHTVTIEFSGTGTVIVSIQNEQLVAIDDIPEGAVSGVRILSLNERGKSTTLAVTKSGETTTSLSLDVIPVLPSEPVEGVNTLKVIIQNNENDALLSPILEIPGIEFNDNPPWNAVWEGRNLTYHEYDSTNKTLRIFPEIVPAKGKIEVEFNATLNAGNVTFEVRVIPMYNESSTLIGRTAGYVKGSGNITVSVLDENDNPIDANITVGVQSSSASSASFAIKEGIYDLKVEKEGYVPVFAKISIKQGENKSITVKLYREENLTTPKLVLFEGTATTLLTVNETVKPNAKTNASVIFGVSLNNINALLSVKMPIYKSNESADFFAFLEKISAENASIASENFTAYIAPTGKEIKLKFEGRKLGDVNNDNKVSIVDALFIAQYLVGKRTLDNTSKTYANVNKDAKLSIVDALFIAQYLVEKRNADYEMVR